MRLRTLPILPSSIALAWSLTGVLHLLTFTWTLPLRWDGVLYTASTFLLLLRPQSGYRQITFLTSTVVVIGLSYEVASNHLVLEFWIIVSVLGALLVRGFTANRRESNRPTPFQVIAPFARIQYLIVFGLAAFSKLNRDFFDPEWSCAALFARQTIEFLKLESLSLGLLSPEQPIVAMVAIYLTIACEIAIPSLLAFRKTRIYGIYLALAFHFVIGFIPILGISSFSALSFTLLLFFFPSRSLSLLEGQLSKLYQAVSRSRATSVLTISAVALILSTVTYLHHQYYHPSPSPIALAVWLITFFPLLYLAVRTLHGARTREEDVASTNSAPNLVAKPVFLNAFNLPVIFLGVLPYLGLQTQGSFTMFSNLRMLGDRPNHLIVKSNARIHRPILVRILSTNHPKLKAYPDSELLITSHELRRKVTNTLEDYFILCEYDETVELIGRFSGDLTPHPFLDSKSTIPSSLMRFRDVSASEHCECAW